MIFLPTPVYSLSHPRLTALHEFLDENMKNRFIRPTRSPWGSPVLFVKKKDRGLRLCMDFQALNKVTEKDCYPLPLITNLLDAPGLVRIYSKIDLKHAYHLVHIANGDKLSRTVHSHRAQTSHTFAHGPFQDHD